ncbi:hypothetical protein NDU88_003548 [Pleurodeles waltl]|uniref:Uncharacterized protein n=1 Tax=Pleurodeles waltl TaxID=8319 RepID=A0AAV7V231_PLEWA|nr:hypothetical protein NDU88_003548 [Pleurodeles waltl]
MRSAPLAATAERLPGGTDPQAPDVQTSLARPASPGLTRNPFDTADLPARFGCSETGDGRAEELCLHQAPGSSSNAQQRLARSQHAWLLGHDPEPEAVALEAAAPESSSVESLSPSACPSTPFTQCYGGRILHLHRMLQLR